MKNVVLVILLLFLNFLTTIAQTGKSVSIYKFVDQRTSLSYEHLMKVHFDELNTKKLRIESNLVDFYSKEKLSLEINIHDNRDGDLKKDQIRDEIVLTLYRSGNSILKKSLQTKKMDSVEINQFADWDFKFDTLEIRKEKLKSIKVSSISAGTKSYKKGLRKDDVLYIEDMNPVLNYVKVNKVFDTGKVKSINLKIPVHSIYELSKPISIKTVANICEQARIEVIKKLYGDVRVKSSWKKRNYEKQYKQEISKYKSLEILPKEYTNRCDNTIIDFSPSIHKHEKFGLPKKHKKTKEINSSLLNMKYCNQENPEHYLANKKDVSKDLIRAIEAYSFPLYNKPSVIINCMKTGLQYQNIGAHQASLNQFRGVYNLINATKTSELAKAEMRDYTFNAMIRSYKALGINDYATVIRLSKKMNKIIKEKSNNSFYESVDTILTFTSEIEGSLKKKNSKRNWAIVGAVASVGASASMASIGGLEDLAVETAASFLESAFTSMDNAFTIEEEFQYLLMELNQSINISVSDEEEEYKYTDLKLLPTFILAYSKDKNKTIDMLKDIFIENQHMTKVLNTVLVESNKGINKLADELIKMEKLTYYYSTHGKSTPKKYRI